jgi:hypothetical protein
MDNPASPAPNAPTGQIKYVFIILNHPRVGGRENELQRRSATNCNFSDGLGFRVCVRIQKSMWVVALAMTEGLQNQYGFTGCGKSTFVILSGAKNLSVHWT